MLLSDHVREDPSLYNSSLKENKTMTINTSYPLRSKVPTVIATVCQCQTDLDPLLEYEWNHAPVCGKYVRSCIHMELSRVEERQRVDDGCTHCVAVHESFASKDTYVTADIKQRIRLRFMLNIPDTNHLKMS